MILCPNCGGNPRFDIASQKMLCPFCGTYSEPTDERYNGADGADTQTVTGDYAGQPDMMQVKIYTCAQCGAELMSTDSDATAFCSYCGTHQVLQERLDVKKRPDHIIPFKITKDQCKDIYKRKLAKMLFAPRALKDPAHIEEFRGIYMPYWFYDFRQKGTIKIDGTQEHRSGNYRIIEHFDLSVDADNHYCGISHDASSSFDDTMSESLAPYNTQDAVDFRTAYLSGFYADIPDTDEKVYEHESALIAAKDCYMQAVTIPMFSGYSTGGNSDESKVPKTHTKLESATAAMFPVWFLSYRNKDRVAYAAINGQTGKLNADIPVDGRKYLIGTAIMTVIIWILLEMFNISSLRGILMTVLMGALAGGLVYAMVLGKLKNDYEIRAWEANMNSPSAPAPQEQTKKSKGKTKSKSKAKSKPGSSGLGLGGTFLFFVITAAVCAVATWLGFGVAMLIVPVILLIMNQSYLSDLQYKRGKLSNIVLAVVMELSIIVWLINPYKDPIYYVCCLLMTICVVWCFFDVLFYYNQLMTRPLPQFNKQGGDDRA